MYYFWRYKLSTINMFSVVVQLTKKKNSMYGSLKSFQLLFFWKRCFLPKSSLLHALALFARQAGLTLSPSESRHNVKLGSHSALPAHPNTFLATTASQFTLWFLRNLVWTEKMLEMPHDKKTWHCHQGRAIKMSSHSALPLLSPPKLLHLNCYTCGI